MNSYQWLVLATEGILKVNSKQCMDVIGQSRLVNATWVELVLEKSCRMLRFPSQSLASISRWKQSLPTYVLIYASAELFTDVFINGDFAS